MSLILDALKKLERDKAARRTSPVRNAADVLKGREEPAEKKRGRFLVGGLAGAALAVVALALAYIIPFSPSTPVPERAIQKSAPAVTPASPPASASERSAAAAPVREQQPAPAGKRLERASVEKGKTARSRPLPARESSPPNADDQPAFSTPESAPHLAVTGILWADGKSSRRAVVNENVVGEGGSVAGAKVVEIRQDHVRFSHGGQFFDVYMR